MNGVSRTVAVAVITIMGIVGKPAAAQSELQDAIERQAFDIRDRFVAEVRNCGVVPTFEPGVVVETHPAVVAYFQSDRSAHLSRWADMPPPITGMVEAWAAKGTLGLSGEGQFVEIFNSLLLAHELGHYLQDLSGRWASMDRWESEVEANRIAIAFWSLDPAEAAKLPARIENFAVFLETLPNPVPTAVRPRDYFNANYEKLGNDAEAYGWYQGAFMRTAWNERAATDFCSLVKLKANAGQVSQ